MEPLSFEICHADGRQERTIAQGARIVIGSGAHCDVRLAADQAAFEHVAIEELAAGPQIRNLAPASATTLDGQPFATRALGPSALACLGIGATQIRILREVRAAAVKSSALGPVMIAKVLVVAALAAAIVKVSRMGPDAPSTISPSMPELFAKTSTDCPRKDLAEARTVADDLFAGAGGWDLAVQRMREETTLDFRARRVRLERVLLVNDYDLAAQDVAVLSALTEGQQGEYPRWLSGIAQDIKNHNAAENGK